MNQKNREVNPRIRKGLMQLVIALYFALLLALFYGVVFGILSSIRYTNTYLGLDGTATDDPLSARQEVQEKEAQRAFLQARVMLLDTDSVSLTVDLADSVVTLVQKGVTLHSADIRDMRISRVFRRIDGNDLSVALSSPLHIQESSSTIPRKRYNVKVAPTDTSNYTPMVTPDTSTQETVCFRLSLDRGIQIEIRQSETPLDNHMSQFQRGITRKESQRILNDLAAFRVPEYRPVIRLDLPEKDARAIYKALPIHAKVALRI